jgi:hypothetical protein
MDAFAEIAPVVDHYASLPVAEAFDWAPLAEALGPGEWYMVAFRSILRADADVELLRRYDDWAHEEAATADGFVHYNKGPLAADRSCLSFCIWNSRAEARAASSRPAHRDAVALITQMYETYILEFLRVSRTNTATSLEFEPYDTPPDPSPALDHRRPRLGFSPTPS